MTKRKVSDTEYISAIKDNITIKAALRSLKLADSAGNYKTVQRIVEKYDINTSHWDPNKARRNAGFNKRMSTEEVFVTNSTFNKHRLKMRIIEDKLIEYACDICHISNWNELPLSLHLDHINGDRYDNRLENLRFLCPNCHSQTETYCGKANRADIASTKNTCIGCGIVISIKAKRCRQCDSKAKVGKNSKIEWPPVEKLIAMVNKTSYTAAGKELGVSDNAVRKHIKKALK